MVQKPPSTGPAYARARAALRRALERVAPAIRLDEKGYAASFGENLVAGVRPEDFKADLDQGAGNELGGKFRAAHSSSALAVNAFARFKDAPSLLSIAGSSGFDDMRFEAKCPAGVLSRRPPHKESPPNLDLLLCGAGRVLGLESKCTEHLTRHRAKFSPSYDEQIRDWRRDTAWFQLMHRLTEDPARYGYLDAAQLVKHAFGLGRTFAGKEVTLVYVYWEPRNAEMIPELREHCGEIDRFANEVAGAFPAFAALSYRELWRSWSACRMPAWLPDHLAALEARYDVEI